VKELSDGALSVLRRNDNGLFVKPAAEVYPFQWNWDSALVAIGLAQVDVRRGRQEVRALLEGQWADGMVPHIVFHPADVRRQLPSPLSSPHAPISLLSPTSATPSDHPGSCLKRVRH